MMLGPESPQGERPDAYEIMVREADAATLPSAVVRPESQSITMFLRTLPAALASRRDIGVLTDALLVSLSASFDAMAGYYSRRGPFAGQVFCCSGMQDTPYHEAVELVHNAARQAFDTLPDEALTEFEAGLPARTDLDSRRAAFVWFDETRSGAFVLYRPESPFAADELAAAAVCAAVAAEVVTLGADITTLEAETRHDYLTGLLNRSFFERALPAEIERARRFGGHFSLAFMDLDGFKRFNDTFGHSRGDDMLRLVGSALTEGIRRADTATRYGGDEFAILFPNTMPQDLEGTLGRLRRRIESIARTLGQDAIVSASFGIAHFPTDAESAEELVATADTRLYHAKYQNHTTGPGRAAGEDPRPGGTPRTQSTTSQS